MPLIYKQTISLTRPSSDRIKHPERFPKSDEHLKSMNKLTLKEPGKINIVYRFEFPPRLPVWSPGH